MSMFGWIRARADRQRQAKLLYGAVVAQARSPSFYSDYGVPDTLQGRYEMIVLVLFQVLERLREAGSAHEELSRVVLESLFTDVDDNMREIGIGDLTVPKKVKRAAAGFYERAVAYRAALAGHDEAALAAHMQQFIDAGANVAGGGRKRLARFAMAQRRALAATDIRDVIEGRGFIDPGQIPA